MFVALLSNVSLEYEKNSLCYVYYMYNIILLLLCENDLSLTSSFYYKFIQLY
jgi:hypothetical protein